MTTIEWTVSVGNFKISLSGTEDVGEILDTVLTIKSSVTIA